MNLIIYDFNNNVRIILLLSSIRSIGSAKFLYLDFVET